MKAVPDPDKLKQFLISAPTLSPDLVGCCLLDQLNEDAWQCRAKALQVVASLGRANGCEVHRKWWSEDAETVEDLQALAAEDPRSNVRSQAQRALSALEINTSSLINTNDNAGGGRKSSQRSDKESSKGNAGTVDLLGELGGRDEVEKAQSQAVLTDIFGDSTKSTALSPTNNDNISDGCGATTFLDEITNVPAAPATVDHGGTGGLVGVIDTSQPPQHNPPPVPVNTAATAQSGASDLLFQGMSIDGTVAATGDNVDLLGTVGGKSDSVSSLSTNTQSATGTGTALNNPNKGSDLPGQIGCLSTTTSGASTTAAQAAWRLGLWLH